MKHVQEKKQTNKKSMLTKIRRQTSEWKARILSMVVSELDKCHFQH